MSKVKSVTVTPKSLPVFEGWSPMMVCTEFDGLLWSDINVKPIESLNIHPAAMALQFGASIFEGKKAMRISQNKVHLFRPDENYQRLKKSAERLCLPCPSSAVYYKALESIVSEVNNWEFPFSSEWLYIRPVLYALDNNIMPTLAKKLIFIIMVAPIRAFTPQTFSLAVETKQHRAVLGGLGHVKTAANYAHQFQATQQAQQKGANAVLWLSALDNNTLEEASTMNIFIVFDGKVVTPQLSDTILPGITRKSVIEILNNRNVEIEERDITLTEIYQLNKESRLQEIFVTSTALGVRAVDTLFLGQDCLHTAKDKRLSKEIANELHQLFLGKSVLSLDWIYPITLHQEAL